MAFYLVDFSNNLVPIFVGVILLVAKLKGVKVYDVFIQGAAEGFSVAVKMIPYLIAILAAVGVARTSGLLELMFRPLQYPLSLLGFPPELLLMALMRPLSGSASFALMVDILQTYGPDSRLGLMASALRVYRYHLLYIDSIFLARLALRNFVMLRLWGCWLIYPE